MGNFTCVLMIRIRQKRRLEFVQSIIADVEWLGAAYDWSNVYVLHPDYFDQMYECSRKVDQERQGLCL